MQTNQQDLQPKEVVVTKLEYKGLQGVRYLRDVKESVIDAQIERLMKKFECDTPQALVESVEGYDTLEQMKEDLRVAKRLQYAAIEEDALQERLVTEAATQMELELPVREIYTRAEQTFIEAERMYVKQKTSLEAYLTLTKQTLQEYKEDLVAKESLKFRKAVLMYQVAQAEQVMVSAQEIAAEYQRIASHRNTTVEQAKRGLTEQTVAHALTVRKVRALLVSCAQIRQEKAPR